MSMFAELQGDALRFIAGFELANGRCPSVEDVADGLFHHDGGEGLAESIVRSLVVEGKLRRLKHSRNRKLQVLTPVAVPRAPDGEPLFFVRIGGAA